MKAYVATMMVLQLIGAGCYVQENKFGTAAVVAALGAWGAYLLLA